MRLSHIGVLSVLLISTSYCSTLYVPSQYSSIGAAIGAAQDYDVIEIAAGTYTFTQPIALVDAPKITISGEGQELVFLNGGAATHLFSFLGCDGITLRDLTFMNGNNTSPGGAVWAIKSSISISDCTFEDNTSTGSYGGAVALDGCSADIRRCLFDGNEVGYRGGGVAAYLDLDDSELAIYSLVIEDTDFSNNSALDGGALHISNKIADRHFDFVDCRLVRCNFNDNTAIESGGGLHYSTGNDAVPQPDFSIYACEFNDNTANALCSTTTVGAGLYFNSTSVSLNAESTTFSRNIATGSTSCFSQGGGVYISTSMPVLFNSCVFEENSSVKGGGVFVCKSEEEQYTDCEFSGNEAENRGGAVYSSGTCRLEVNGGSYSGNSAGSSGGSIYRESETYSVYVRLIDATFDSNTVTGVFFGDTRNPAGGGACAFASSSTNDIVFQADMSSCSFLDNYVMYAGNSHNLSQGGAILLQNHRMEIEACAFLRCGSVNGGAIGIKNDRVINSVAIQHKLDSCTFQECTATNKGGAVNMWYNAGGGIDNFLALSEILSACTFTECSADSGGAVCWKDDCIIVPSITENRYVLVGPDFENCRFEDCSAELGETFSAFARNIPYYEWMNILPHSFPRFRDCYIQTTSDVGDDVSTAEAIHTKYSPVSMTNCLIVNTGYGPVATSVYAYDAYNSGTGDALELQNCTFIREGGQSGTCIDVNNISTINVKNTLITGYTATIVPDNFNQVFIDHTDLYGNSSNWNFYISEQQGQNGNVTIDPGLCDYLGDYKFELRWDSPLVDAGDPAVQYNDYDLTASDIGWHRPLEVEVLSGSSYSANQLARKVYEIDAASCVINCSPTSQLSPGTVIRVGEDNSLKITAPHGTDIVFGDLDGPRSALVGVQNADNYGACTRIEIGDYINSTTTPLSEAQLEGVLFNYAPSDGVVYNHCEVDLVDPVVTFYEGTGSGLLEFQFCKGDVAAYNFIGTQFARMYQYRSSVDVTSCSFPVTPDQTQWTVSIYRNHPERSYLSLEDLSFPGSGFNQFDRAVVKVAKASVNITDCMMEAQDDQDVPMILEEGSVLDMAKNARNELYDNGIGIPALIEMNYGNVNLYCGYNVFIRTNAQHTYPMITSNVDVWSHQDIDWGLNYWGESCSQEISITDLVDDDMLPYWQDDPWGDWSSPLQLQSCREIYNGCNWTYPTTKELIAEARVALESGDDEEALNVASLLILQYPNSAEAYEATNIVGSIGTNTETGAELYDEVATALSDASEISESYDHGLSVVQTTEALLVEARHGDRASVVAQLEQEVQASEDAFVVTTSEQALLEIETWPSQGGMAAANPDVAAANEVRIQQAVVALRDYGRAPESKSSHETGADEALLFPGRISLLQTYPNPFNPMTTVQFEVSTREVGSVVVFNMLGQKTCTLFDGEFEQGMNAFTFDGSSLASGVYLITARTEQDCKMSKVLLLK